jgi:hypothetical protein
VAETKRRSRAVHEVPPVEEPADEPVVCNVAFCPICIAVTTSAQVAPDVINHLLSAAKEFFLAARAVIDVRADDLEGGDRPGPTHLEKIDIG